MPDEQVFSDRYQLIRHIARGGMAQVYLAKDLLLGRPVALKVLFPELSVDRSFVERFRREARAAANLSHPNIVSVYDWGQGGRTYFIVMEYVDGQTLSQLIRGIPRSPTSPGPAAPTPPAGTTAPGPGGPPRISPDRAAEIGAEVAAALDFAHRHGVIHRDVKPGNVLIDTTGHVKVTDFGIARAVGAQEGLTQTGAVMGTATYFSPEQAQGFPVDARSDVYSLGVVLYEMAVGHPPFAGDNPLSIAYQHVRQDPAPPTTENHTVPPALEAIILKAMTKAPEGRYQTAEELRADLQRFREGLPVLAEAELAAQSATRVQPGVPSTAVMGAVGAGAVAGTHRGTAPPLAPPPAGYPAPYEPDGGPPEEERRRDRRNLLILLAVLALIAAALALFFGGRAAGWWGSSAKTAAIPSDLVGKSPTAAETELRRLGFGHFATAQATSPTVDPGLVATTRPAPGTPTRTDQTVTLVVSSGPGSADVPNVVNQPADQATSTLQHAGFVVTPTEAASTTIAKGNVISTSPPAGQPATKGSTVQLVVSSGPPQVTIPSLVNTDPTTAGSRLAALGLSVTQQNEPSNSVAAGRVTRTDPPAGTGVSVGSTVTVYVSTGPQQVTVPKLEGATQPQATAILNAAGLHGSFISQPVSQPGQNGLVLNQNPPDGSQVAPGSTVTAVVGQYTPPPTTTPTTAPTTTTTASTLLPATPAGGPGSGGGGGGGPHG